MLSADSRGQHGFNIWFQTIFILTPILLCAFMTLVQYKSLKNLENQGYFNNIIEGSANDNEILLKNEMGETKLNWKNFHKTTESEDAFWLFYIKSPTAFQIIPKRAFTSETDIEKFKDHLKSRIPNYETRIKSTTNRMSNRTKVIWGIFAICVLILLIQAILDPTK